MTAELSQYDLIPLIISSIAVIISSILVKREGLSEKEREDVWELVSSYNRLGFVLHNYSRVFLFLSSCSMKQLNIKNVRTGKN